MLTNDIITRENSKSIVKFIRAHGKHVIGSKSVKKDIMLSYTLESNPTECIDIFLDQKQAEALIIELKAKLEDNERD